MPTIQLSWLQDSSILTLVKHYEGLYLNPYRCPAGVWTIGYGHTGKDVTCASLPITEQVANELLLKDLMEAGRDVIRLAGPYISMGLMEETKWRFEALCSWVFNLGAGNLASSTMLKKIRVQDWDGAANEMLRWDKATVGGMKKTLPGLTKRRQSERHYFLTGEVMFP